MTICRHAAPATSDKVTDDILYTVVRWLCALNEMKSKKSVCIVLGLRVCVKNVAVQSVPTRCGLTKYRIGRIGRIGTQSIACCSGVGAALHQGAPAFLIECSGSCLRNYTGLFCLVKINAHIHSFIVIC